MCVCVRVRVCGGVTVCRVSSVFKQYHYGRACLTLKTRLIEGECCTATVTTLWYGVWMEKLLRERSYLCAVKNKNFRRRKVNGGGGWTNFVFAFGTSARAYIYIYICNTNTDAIYDRTGPTDDAKFRDYDKTLPPRVRVRIAVTVTVEDVSETFYFAPENVIKRNVESYRAIYAVHRSSPVFTRYE